MKQIDNNNNKRLCASRTEYQNSCCKKSVEKIDLKLILQKIVCIYIINKKYRMFFQISVVFVCGVIKGSEKKTRT